MIVKLGIYIRYNNICIYFKCVLFYSLLILFSVLFFKNLILMFWGGWNDDFFGIWKFEYEVYEIGGIFMVEGKVIIIGIIYLNKSYVSY